MNRHQYVGAFLKVVTPHAPQLAELPNTSLVALSEETAQLRDRFERLQLNMERVAYWRGWNALSDNGTNIWLPLAPFFLLYGLHWTQRFYETLRTSVTGLRLNRVPGLLEFSQFVELRKPARTVFLSQLNLLELYRDFYTWFIDQRKALDNLATMELWLRFRHWALEIFPKSKLFTVPVRGFPGPVDSSNGAAKSLNSRRTRASRDEADENELLLLDVPITASDTEALEQLVARVPLVIEATKRWAAAEANAMMTRFKTARRLADSGSPRILQKIGINGDAEKFKIHSDNPQRMANAAATYELYGYQTAHDFPVTLLYPKPLRQTAEFLGLPVSESLMPFAATLVANHPEITPAYLSGLQLFDKNGKLAGLRVTGGSTYLVSVKPRKGKTGEQPIRLNPQSLRAVRQLLVLTAAVRGYLKTKKDDSWRLLFLSTGKGFGYPLAVSKFSYPVHRLKAELMAGAGVTDKDASDLASRFSLRGLRATKAIQILIETHSESQMADALGHQQFDPHLLARYLPGPIRAFFRVRWIRAFQTHLLIEATRGTPWTLDATGLNSDDEVTQFLEKNAFTKLPVFIKSPDAESLPSAANDSISPIDDAMEGRFIFNASPTTLKFLWIAVERDTQAHTYWGSFGRHFFGLMEDRRGIDPEIDEMVANAKAEG